MPNEEDVLSGVFLLGHVDKSVDVTNEIVPVVNVPTRNGVVDVGVGALAVTAVVNAVDGVARLVELLGDVVVAAVVLGGTVDDDNDTLGVLDGVGLLEEHRAVLVLRRDVARGRGDLRSGGLGDGNRGVGGRGSLSRGRETGDCHPRSSDNGQRVACHMSLL